MQPHSNSPSVEALFQAAADLPAGQRSVYLHQQAGSDPALRAEVERLLQLLDDDEQTAFLEAPAFREACSAANERSPEWPARIGHYRILRMIGAGGMGVVYEAEQHNPRRTVALKVIRSGVLAPHLLKRFEREAHLLGQLRHPGIARIYEAGSVSTDSGQTPYFAMELIIGATLTDHVRSHALTSRERVELMARVCDAVAHAHSRGIIHRDLKPANILVEEDDSAERTRPTGMDATTARGRVPGGGAWPKILDFGVARATATDLGTMTLQTNEGQLIGTIPYMSPEQVAGASHAVDVRSDVYSLGVVLFELLAGRLPHDVRGRSIPDAVRVIRDEDPSRLGSIVPVLRGELEIIVDKALEKDPVRRYATAAALADDLRRYLRDEPIEARPASAFYQFRKFARRHKAWFAGTVALAMGCAGAVTFAIREVRARHDAQQKTLEAEQLAYQASLAAAQASLAARDARVARRSLEAAPPALRGWEWKHLQYLTDRSLCTVGGHAPGRTRACSGPDGSVISIDVAGKLQQWSPPACVVKQPMDTPFRALDAIELRPGHPQLLCVESGTRACLWDMETRSIRWSLSGEFLVSGGSFSPDGDVVVMARVGSPILVFAAADDGRVIVEHRIESPVGRMLSFSPDGARLACDPDYSAQVFDVNRTDDVITLNRAWQRRDLGFPRFSRDARYMLCATNTQPVLLNAQDGREIHRFPAVARLLATVSVSPDGAYAMALDSDGLSVLYDMPSGEVITTFNSSAQTITGDSRYIVAQSSDGQTQCWDIGLGSCPLTRDSTNDVCTAAALSPDGRFIALGGAGQLQLMDISSGEEVWSSMVSRQVLQAVAFSHDGRRIATGGNGSAVTIVNAADGRIVTPAISTGTIVKSIAAEPDSPHWMVGGSQRMHRIDMSTDPPMVTSVGVPAGTVHDIAVDTKHRRLATACADGVVRVLDTTTQVDRQLAGPGGPLTCAAYSQQGEWLCVAGSRALRLWRCDDWTVVRDFPVESDTIALTFHPDGNRMASVHADRVIRIWETSTGHVLVSFRASPLMQRGLAFTPDGNTLCVPGNEPRLTLFETGPPTGGFARRELVRRGRRIVDPFMPDRSLMEDTLAQVQSMPDIEQDVRETALKLAQVRGDQVNWLNSDAWGIARYPGKAPERYQLAKRKIDRACSVWPEDWGFLNTRGLVEYRLGLFAQALDTLVMGDRVRRRTLPSHPLDLAFMAMCRRQLADVAGAKQELAAAQSLLATPEYRNDSETQELVQQAAIIVEAP